ncbi:discoidin domain-containing protein [Clostridium perfringens]|uniref:discoidin domain-containing protein n=1 Tax=Clostridium perfringens TaxID=1502 RepID=UPI001ABBBE97|nr:discoidin domain-containing protein [Clostridium perfringens]MBO3387844.1 discoidin domain-containing protein [Clostridium perfringens]MBO3413301.1 discoidin domain-containing protein [Clostridium perfringens]
MNKKKIGALLCGIFIANFIGSSATITVKAKDKVDDLREEYVNLALEKDVKVSGLESTNSWKGDKAVDGDYITEDSRWSSGEVTSTNPQWLSVDLGDEYVIDHLNIRWQNFAYATEFKIQKSSDNENWTDITGTLTNPLGKNEADRNKVNRIDLEKEETTRYIRVLITKKNQWNSVSIREFEVMGYKLFKGNVAEGKETKASAVENNNTNWGANKVVDGDKTSDDSRWSSPTMPVIPNNDSHQWVYIDFGKSLDIESAKIHWYKKAFAEDYSIEVSDDGKEWREVKKVTHNSGNNMNMIDEINFDNKENARYLRVYIRERNANAYNNVSIREIEVWGEEKIVPDFTPSLEQIANGITSLPEVTISDEMIKLPEVPEGFGIKLKGSEFENVITHGGEITDSNIVDRDVSLLFEIYKEDEPEKTVEKSLTLTVPEKTSLNDEFFPKVDNGNGEPKVIPSLQEWYGLEGNFNLTEGSRILINDKNNVNLMKVAKLFNESLKDFKGIELEIVEVSSDESVKEGDIYIESQLEDKYEVGKEGYFTQVQDSIKIYSSYYTGALYGTTTLLQILWQDENHSSIPCGVIRDFPKYEIRGAMLDVARMPMRMEFLEDYSKILSWYKINEFHIHLNDNQWAPQGTNFNKPENWDSVYSAFRLESKNHPGLKPSNDDLNDPYYTQEEFVNLQKDAMNRGMEVVPEIDTPAHSLPFTKYNREKGTPINSEKYWFDHIDIDNPEGAKFIKGLFDEFLDEENPIFLGDTVHLGIDEYDTRVGDKFRKYAADMSQYLIDKGKTPRVWGSLKPFGGETMLPKDTIIDVWSLGWEDPKARIDEGYKLVNVPQPYTYITPSRWHKDFMDTQYVYNNWEPVQFNGNTSLPLGEPNLLGGKMAIWGDESMEGIVEMDLHERLLPAVATIGEKTWRGNREDKDYTEFMKTFNSLDEGPNTEVSREVESKSDIVLEYDFKTSDGRDTSGNAYDGTIKNGEFKEEEANKYLSLNGETVIETPLKAITYPYTVSFDLKVEELGNVMNIFSGYEGELKVLEDGTLSIRRSFYEQNFDYKIQKDKWTNITLVGTFENLALYVDGEFVQQLHSNRKHDNSIISGQEFYTTFVLPLEKIGEGLKGGIDNIKLYNRVLYDEAIGGEKNSKVNLACGKDAYSSSNDLLYTNEWRATDGNIKNEGSKWVSKNSDNQWLMVDLGKVTDINEVLVRWSNPASEFSIEISEDGENWNKISSVTNNLEKINSIEFGNEKARYVRVNCIKRTNNSPYSILELEVYGEQKKVESLQGDFNENGNVDLGDLALASKYYGKEKEEWDLDGDKVIGEYEINFISERVLD